MAYKIKERVEMPTTSLSKIFTKMMAESMKVSEKEAKIIFKL